MAPRLENQAGSLFVAAIYSAATKSWTTSLFWAVIGLLLAGFTALVGVFCGRLGASLARFGRSTTS
jgi:hypothetical protein